MFHQACSTNPYFCALLKVLESDHLGPFAQRHFNISWLYSEERSARPVANNGRVEEEEVICEITTFKSHFYCPSASELPLRPSLQSLPEMTSRLTSGISSKCNALGSISELCAIIGFGRREKGRRNS